MNRPSVYLAGKISGNQWRQNIISNIAELSWLDSPVHDHLFSYVGPFFIRCDHGCYHGTNTHGSINIGDNLCPGIGASDVPARQKYIANRCFYAIDTADFLFAYINDSECEGTAAELGYALAKKTPFVIAFGPNISTPPNHPFWLISTRASQVHFNVTEPDLEATFNRSLEIIR